MKPIKKEDFLALIAFCIKHRTAIRADRIQAIRLLIKQVVDPHVDSKGAPNWYRSRIELDSHFTHIENKFGKLK